MVAHHADDFDVIPCHIDWVHLPLLERLSVPFLTTMHGRLDLPALPAVARRFPRAPFVLISDDQRTVLAEANWLGTVYHGLPPDSLRPRYDSGGYLAFLGRLTLEKGPHVAIRLVHAANLPLRIAAKVPRGERGYFKEPGGAAGDPIGCRNWIGAASVRNSSVGSPRAAWRRITSGTTRCSRPGRRSRPVAGARWPR
jgi:hypothetical protein